MSTANHLLRFKFGAKGVGYRIVCPYATVEADEPGRPRCRPADLAAGLPCLVTMHLATRGIESTWVGPDIQITTGDTFVSVTWGEDGYARLSPAAWQEPHEPTIEDVAERLANASGFVRYRSDDRWRQLLAERHHVDVAFNKARERGVTAKQEETLGDMRDRLHAWHDEREKQGATRR